MTAQFKLPVADKLKDDLVHMFPGRLAATSRA